MLRRVVFVAALGIVLVLMLRPVPDVPGNNDKVDHVVVFLVLTAIGVWALFPLARLASGLAGYGALTEVLQSSLTSERQGDPRDLVADVLGILLVVLGVLAFRRVRRASSDPAPPHG